VRKKQEAVFAKTSASRFSVLRMKTNVILPTSKSCVKNSSQINKVHAPYFSSLYLEQIYMSWSGVYGTSSISFMENLAKYTLLEVDPRFR
jgi:hypothetical protein